MTPEKLARLYALPVLLPFLEGCATGTQVTTVEGRIEPRHFRFVTVVEQRGSDPGGWRAACIHVRLTRDTGGDAFMCKMGVDMPIRTAEEGLISTALAQRIAADCANLAAQIAFAPTTPETPLGLACETFKGTYGEMLYRAVIGSRVKTMCHKNTEPVEVRP